MSESTEAYAKPVDPRRHALNSHCSRNLGLRMSTNFSAGGAKHMHGAHEAAMCLFLYEHEGGVWGEGWERCWEGCERLRGRRSGSKSGDDEMFKLLCFVCSFVRSFGCMLRHAFFSDSVPVLIPYLIIHYLRSSWHTRMNNRGV
jgi:hypothetical protein